jgi:universal stress protein A
MKTILVAIDLSPVTRRVCATACRLAKSMSARLVLLHVVPPQLIALRSYGFAAAEVHGMLVELERRSARELTSAGTRCARSGATVQTIQRKGDPAATIMAKAASMHAAMIVLGSHGHTAAFDLLVGSVAQKVLRRARVPVLVVPVAERRN